MFHVKHLDCGPSVATLSSFVQVVTCRGVCLDKEQQDQLALLAQWLVQKAPRIGLSKYNTLALVWQRALAPVVPIYDVVDINPIASCADLGAGTGALGLTLAIMEPHLQVDLVDRSQRAIDFMQLVSKRLNLSNVHVLCSQVEELHRYCPDGYELVAMRALTSGERALILAKSVVKMGGYIAAWHQSADPAYLHPPSGVQAMGSTSTVVPGLQLSIYKRVM